MLQVMAVREFYEKEHDNLVQVDANRSKWWVWNLALEVGKLSVRQIQTYLQRIQHGKPM